MTILLLTILGMCLASFLNAASYRLANDLPIANGRSMCTACKTRIAWFDLIPVVSFVILRGRCRTCHKPFSSQYLLTELVLGALFLAEGLSFLSAGVSTGEMVLHLFTYCVLVFLFIHDLRYFILPDLVTLPALVITITARLLLGASWQNLLLAILVGAGFFAIQFAVSRGKWIGGGDIRMGALLGAIVGWPYILLTLLLAYILGAGVALILLAAKKVSAGSKLPFGTFLALAGIITIWWGEAILTWYLSFL